MVQIVSQENLSERIGQQFGGGLTAGLSQGLAGQLAKQQELAKQIQNQQFQQQLAQAGFSPQQAELFGLLPTGAQTELAKHIFETQERGMGPAPFEGFQPSFEEEEIETPDEKILAVRDKGLTQKEKVNRQQQRYDKNLPFYQDLEKKKTSQELEGMKIQQLQTLNDTGELPENLGRLNVNFKTGELRLPFASTPEAELFSKTVNDFLVGAKDTFGARVTNFEVNRFLKRLPTLANSTEGRTAILRQMDIINQLNQLHADSVLNTFEKAGGIRNIDIDQAERHAKRGRTEQEKALKTEFADLDKLLTKKARKTTQQEDKNTVLMRDPSGALRRVSKKDAKAAQDAGYTKER